MLHRRADHPVVLEDYRDVMLGGIGRGSYRRTPSTDIALAVALTVATQVELWTSPHVADPLWAQATCFTVATLAVGARRSAPLAAATAAAAALTAQVVLLGDAAVVGGFVAALVVTYSVAAHASLPAAVTGAAAIAVAVVAEPVADASSRSAADVLGNVAVLGAVWSLGWVVRRLRARGEHLHERATSAEAMVEEEARRAVHAERERIARELHDVVAYGVSLMVLQAGAARQLLAPGHRATDPLLTVEETGRQALEEMHRMLLVLRRADERGRDPLASLDQLDALVAQVRSTGLDVHLTVDGNRRALPAGLEVTAYRIVQEALTNVLKHVGAGRARVHVTYGDSAMHIEVTDDGDGTGSGVSGAGQGLVGLHERAALYGGSLTAAPRPEGGFAVVATLPLPRHRVTQ